MFVQGIGIAPISVGEVSLKTFFFSSSATFVNYEIARHV
jgi:hypothetical protein